jgi:lipoate---protein ligase
VSEAGLFDVDSFRPIRHRVAILRSVVEPTLVLGSTQDAGIVDTEAAARLGIRVTRRRSGGGAVLVEPGRTLWLDTWVPRGDPLWQEDVGRAPIWIGEWWKGALGVGTLEVHHGRPTPARWSSQVCFAGVGPGEVVDGRRKVVGVAQWRSREGALSHSLAYVGVDWVRTVELLRLDELRVQAASELAASTMTLAELGVDDPGVFTRALLERLPERASWELRSPTS